MEFLVRIVAKSDREPGDVITAQEDGWPWTEAERTNPEWRIVRAPVVRSVGGAMVAMANTQDRKPQRFREWKLHLDLLPEDLKSSEITDVSRAAFLAAAQKKLNADDR